ncbi:MAG TPA: NADPH-dependent F420 reductase [Povalibacter sp.]|mgnify:FL=1|uniref:NADPH-dependent F420 reductase n=1 Tax=Povalibacter sp. TaxID=1962978 RepID=UPI002BCA8919|nr:NADPH-dependent F420 reductase [Povalibacter sp.]HMN44140.1 NADPH-dependent F420 reductase [Povalibacter sp.]
MSQNMSRRFAIVAGLVAALALGLPASSDAADAAKVKIGIIGAGKVGSALGTVWAKAGHPVMFSSRHLDEDKALAAQVGANASAGTPQQAAAFGDVIVMSVPYSALPDLGKSLAAELKGKVIIDACNPFPARDGEIANWAREKGAGLASAELLPGTRIVRAFNAVGAARMATAHETPGQIGLPIAGDDRQAIEIASTLIREIGYEPVLIGGLEMGKHLMPGTALAGERSPEEVRKVAAGL